MRQREREERASLTDLKLGAGWGGVGRLEAVRRTVYARTREAEYGRAARSVVGGGRHRRRRSRSAGVVGRDAVSSPALAQLLRRRRRECVAARCRSPRSRAATGVTLALSLSSPSSLRRLAAVHLVAIFRHGDSELLCDTVKRDGALSRGQLQCIRAVIRKRLFGAPRGLDFENRWPNCDRPGDLTRSPGSSWGSPWRRITDGGELEGARSQRSRPSARRASAKIARSASATRIAIRVPASSGIGV